MYLFRPNSSNLPCLYSTFHLEYPLVLSRFCLDEGRGGDALMHVFIWEYGNSHSQPLLQNCLMDVYGTW